ncbi:MAG: hypothetical protein GXP32_09400, partial [Kiritimatiellaeota bacterium]|nr:hypothetical protein [Kiritimatiellota bacterium]
MKTLKLPRHIRLAALQCDFEGGEDNTLRIPELWREFADAGVEFVPAPLAALDVELRARRVGGCG